MQSEYPMWSPHEKARLYKKFTGGLPVEMKDNEVITVQQNRYVYAGKLKWVEATEKERNDEQPMDGLLVENDYLTIRTNSLKDFHAGDIIQLPDSTPHGGLWVIASGARAAYTYTPKQVQTYQYLPLSTLG